MTPPLLRLLESILIDSRDEHNSREVITMAQSMGLFLTMAEGMGLYAFGTVNDDFLLSLYPEDCALTNYSITKIIYPEAIEENNRMKITSVTSTHPSRWALTTWDYSAKIIIRKLDQLGVDWASIECVQSEGERAGVRCTEITVVVTVHALPMMNWAFVTLIHDIHAMTEARVEIRIGKLVRHDAVVVDNFTDQTAVVVDNFTDQTFLPPGSDVSFHYVLGEFSGGTIGGIIELVDGDGACQKLCALTCRSYLPLTLPAPDTGLDLGLSRTPLQRYGAITCSYPNNHSWFQQVRDVSRELEWLHSQIERIETDWTHDFGPQIAAEQRTYLKSKKAEIHKKKQLISEDSPSIGTIYAFSGTRITRNHHLDWALVELEGARDRLDGVNMIRESLSFNQIMMPPTSTETLKPGSAIYKAKYPDLTGGHVSYTKSYVRYKDKGSGEIKVAAEWAVIPVRNHEQFSEPKDCGAWVVDRIDNTVVGVIYAMNIATGVAYVTPIQEIFDDIEKDTGLTVRLPKRNGC